MRGARWWPVAIILVLGTTVVANLALFWAANHDPGFAAEPDYYQRAVTWDSTVAQRARNAELGWQVAATIEPPRKDGGAIVTVELGDRAGAPIDGAAVRIDASHNASAGRIVSIELLPAGAGRYQGTIPLAAAGFWRLELTATHGAERFQTRLSRETGRADPRS